MSGGGRASGSALLRVSTSPNAPLPPLDNKEVILLDHSVTTSTVWRDNRPSRTCSRISSRGKLDSRPMALYSPNGAGVSHRSLLCCIVQFNRMLKSILSFATHGVLCTAFEGSCVSHMWHFFQQASEFETNPPPSAVVFCWSVRHTQVSSFNLFFALPRAVIVQRKCCSVDAVKAAKRLHQKGGNSDLRGNIAERHLWTQSHSPLRPSCSTQVPS